MTPHAALLYLRAAGLTLEPGPDGLLLVSPAEKLTPELRELCKEHKPMLLALLEGGEAVIDAVPFCRNPVVFVLSP